MPPGTPACSLAAWSASMVRGGSSSIRRGCLPSAKKLFGFIANLRQAHYKSNAKTTPQRATVAKPRTPTYLVGALPASVRPEPVEGPVLRSLEGGPHHHQQPPHHPFTPASARTSPRRARRHTDTTLLPPLRCLRYRLPMAITISHRNQNTTDLHASGGPSPVVGGMVRIDGQRWLVKYQEGLFILCKKLFGFIANLRQARYKSNAKTTPQRATVAKSRTPTYLVGPLPESVLPERVEGSPPPPASHHPRYPASSPPPHKPHPSRRAAH